MSTKNLIDAIEQEKSADIIDTFESEIAARLTDKIDQMRTAVAQTMFMNAEDDSDTED